MVSWLGSGVWDSASFEIVALTVWKLSVGVEWREIVRAEKWPGGCPSGEIS